MGRGLWEPRPSPVGTALSQLTSQKEPDCRLSRSGRRLRSRRAGTHWARLSPPSSCSRRRGRGAWGLWGLCTELKLLYLHVWEYLWSQGFPTPQLLISSSNFFPQNLVCSAIKCKTVLTRPENRCNSEKNMSWSDEVWGDHILGRVRVRVRGKRYMWPVFSPAKGRSVVHCCDRHDSGLSPERACPSRKFP